MALIQPQSVGNHAMDSNLNSHVNYLVSNFKPQLDNQGIICSCQHFSKTYKNIWILDTGATDHILCNFNYFTESRPVSNVNVRLQNGELIPVTHMGSVQLSPDLVLSNVLYVLAFHFNLISASKLTDDRHTCLIVYHDSCFIQELPSWRRIGLAKRNEGLYQLVQEKTAETQKNPVLVNNVITHSAAANLWHYRLVHLSSKALKSMQRIEPSITDSVKGACDVCHYAKQRKLPFPVSTSVSNPVFELIHVDIWGPVSVASINGFKYFLTIVDNHSRCTWLFLMKHKSETRTLLSNFVNYAKTQFDIQVKTIRSDNGLEFMDSEFYQKTGIIHQTSCVYTPKQNGIVERKHQHILNVARALRFQSSLDLKFWSHCVQHATYLINRTPSPVLKHKTPYELLYDKMPTLTHLKVFGSLCYASTNGVHKSKFDQRSLKCIFLGFPSSRKGFILYCLTTQQLLISRHVIFYEHIFPFGSDSDNTNSSSFTELDTDLYLPQPTISTPQTPSTPQTSNPSHLIP